MYVIAVVSYFMLQKVSKVDDSIRGTGADPLTILDASYLNKVETFLDLTGIVALIEPVFVVVLLIGLYKSRLNEKLVWFSSKLTWKFTQFIIYTFLIAVLLHVAKLPFAFIQNIRWQSIPPGEIPFGTWFVDYLFNIFNTWGLVSLILAFIYICMHYFNKRWWIVAWIVSVPVIYLLFGMEQQTPIEGLEELKQGEIVEEIEALLKVEDLKLEGVYLFEASEFTESLNVAVFVVGEEVQVVVWDTALEKLTTEELVYIVANEWKQLKYSQSVFQIVILIVVSYIAFYVAGRIMKRFATEEDYGNFKTVPISWAIVIMVLFLSTPILNAFERDTQYQADQAALQITGEVSVAQDALKKMALHQPVQLNESILLDWFGSGQVSLIERLKKLQE